MELVQGIDCSLSKIRIKIYQKNELNYVKKAKLICRCTNYSYLCGKREADYEIPEANSG